MKKLNIAIAMLAVGVSFRAWGLSATVSSVDWNAEKRQFTVEYELSGGGAMVNKVSEQI